MNLEQVKSLHYHQEIYDSEYSNADGSPARWRVTGKVQLWKKDSSKIRVPLKHGLYDYGEINQNNMFRFFLTSKEAEQNR